MRTLSKVTVLLLAIGSFPTWAGDIDQIDQIVQADFHALSRDLSATVSYKAIVPIETLGIAGFDIGIAASATKLKYRTAWDNASSGSASQTVYLSRVHVHKGLPAGFDVGMFYAESLNTNVDAWGAEIRYAILKGGTLQPAIGIRGSYSKLTGVDQLSLQTKALDVGISKGFANITPYAGVGRVWSESTPVGVTNVHPEKFTARKLYVGGNINFIGTNLAMEADKVGDTVSYSVKFGFRF